MNRRMAALGATGALLALTAFGAAPAAAQTGRPRADVTAVVESVAGTSARVSLRVRLPKDIHVQAHEPRDPLLIPTVLTIEPPAGVTVEAITYPKPTEFVQAGRPETLPVLGPEFHIDVRLTVPADATGELLVPLVLRYQACNESVCFPPARATAQWRVTATP